MKEKLEGGGEVIMAKFMGCKKTVAIIEPHDLAIANQIKRIL